MGVKYRAVRCGVVWCGVVWCGVVRCGAVRYGRVLWYTDVRFGVGCGTVRDGGVCCGTTVVRWRGATAGCWRGEMWWVAGVV